MLTSTAFAPSIDAFSNSGLLIDCFAASTALFVPSPNPSPIRASPLPFITVFTSAKSMLISPGSVIRSEMPCTACNRAESARRNAFLIGVFCSTTFNKCWLGMMMRVSTLLRSFSIPCSARLNFFFPSNVNGVVTTATVKALQLFAISATTAAAPVPVPPPIPAVIKTISAFSSSFLISSLLSCAAFSPISGWPPAPSPPVSSLPMAILVWALERCRAWTSVFNATKDTFFRPLAIILFTALPPPPPTPTTLIIVGVACSPVVVSSISNKLKLISAP